MLQKWLLGLSLLSLPFWWGETTDLRIADSTPLAELTDFTQGRNPILAPDGSAIAWTDGDGLCVFRFEPADRTCTPWPEDARLNSGPYNLPLWSPDSRQIVLHEDFLIYLNDSDLWTFDVDSRVYTNLTDDGYTGGLLRTEDTANLTIDFAPTFHPISGELYFFRLLPTGPEFTFGEAQAALMKRTPAGEIEQVRLMRPDVPGPTSIYRPGAFSADGNLLYLTVAPPDWHRNEATGIYALDLRDNSFERLASLGDLQAALPAWSREEFAPGLIQPARNGLVVWLESTSGMPGFVFRTPVYFDLVTGAVTSLVDYSGFDGEDALAAARSSPDISTLDFPYAGIVMPGEQTYWLMVTRPPDDMAVFALPLPPGDAEPALLTRLSQRLSPGQDAPPTLSEDGKLLIQDVLYTLEPDE